MHALLGETGELDELVLGREPQLEPRRAQSQVEERREVYRSTLTYTERGFGPSNSQRKIAW